jgi:hypothetical protein
MYDFQHMLGIDLGDLWRGTLTARRALVLSGQLLEDPLSHFRAEHRGDMAFLGWDEETYLLADTRDLLLSIAAGLGGEKITADDFWPRPTRTVVTDGVDPEVGTIAEFDTGGFMRMIAGG